MLNRKSWMTPILAAVLLAAACTGNNLDDGSSPDVVIEVAALENSPVTAQQAEGDETGCTLEVVDWTASIENIPKNTLAGTSPYNDVVMTVVIIEYYDFDDNDRANLLFGPRVVGLGDVTIPAGATNSVSFAPISFQDLASVSMGSTLNLVLTFRAQTVEGTTISDTVDRQLFIELCTGG